MDPAADFSTGEKRTTDMVNDGTVDVLSSSKLNLDCDKKAMIGFNLVTDTTKEGSDMVGYEYYCDDSGAPFKNSNMR